ncbi:MAG: hypothetical protein Salg2KO_15340 [Salibacteraceae bacterium]
MEGASGERKLELQSEVCYATYDYELGVEMAQWLVQEAVSQGDTYYQAMGYHHLGTKNASEGRFLESIEYHRKAIALFRSMGRIDKVARQNGNLGNRYASMGNYDSALVIYKRGLSQAISVKDTYAVYGTTLNISTIYNDLGDKELELEYIMKARDLALQIGSPDEIALVTYNIAVFYGKNEEFEKAEELANAAFKVYKSSNNLYGLGSVHTLRAEIDFLLDNFDAAMSHLDSAINYYRAAGDTARVANIYLNQGSVYLKQKRLEEGYEKTKTAMEIFDAIGDQRFSASSRMNLAEYYFEKGKISEAKTFASQAVEIGKQQGYRSDLIKWLGQLSKYHEALGDYKNAYELLDQRAIHKDSLHKENSENAIAQAEAQFQNELKQLEIESLESEKEAQLMALELEQTKRNWILFGLFLALLMVVLVGFALVQKRKDNRVISAQKQAVEAQNAQIEQQKVLVEEKNREITDSITYAKRIQQAILPEEEYWKRMLPNSFVLFKPKDIVAGDFYWMEETEDKLLFAAADCTGHGVPGAMVSVVCHNALNRAVREYKLSEPSLILDKVRELVIETFQAQSSTSIKDGMDIALCAIDKEQPLSAKRTISFAGANNPLWVISRAPMDLTKRAELNELMLYEVRADKQPVGNYHAAKPFEQHAIELTQGDTFYIFSDGFADQFGGPQGKKFKPSSMRQLFLEVQGNSLENQRKKLDERIENWRGGLEQVDDICVIGVSV